MRTYRCCSRNGKNRTIRSKRIAQEILISNLPIRFHSGGIPFGDIKLGVARVTDTRREAKAQKVYQREHVIGDARGVGVGLLDAQVGFVI